MHFRTKCLVLCSLALAAVKISAQFRSYGTSDGLPQSWVFSFVKDKMGRLWMATGDGITRFDGTRFTAVTCFNNKQVPVKRFGGSFKTDRNHNIWIGGLHGIFCYEQSKGHFTDKTHLLGQKELSGTAKIIDCTGPDLWVLDESNTIFHYNHDNRSVFRYHLTPFLKSSDGISAVSPGPEGSLYIATTSHLLRIKRNDVMPEFLSSDLESAGRKLVQSGKECFITGLRLRLIDSAGRVSTPLWPQYLDGSCFVRDVLAEGDSIWVGTSTRGLLLFHRKHGFIRQYSHSNDDPEGIPANDVSTIYRSENEYFIGTDGGGFSILQVRPPLFTRFDDRNNEHLNKSSFIKCLYQDESGRVWAGTLGAGLIIFSPDLKESAVLNSLPGKTVSLIQKDHKGRLWVGTDRGLFRVIETTGQAIPVSADPMFQPQEGASPFFRFAESPAGNIYIASTMGVLWLNADSPQPEFKVVSDTGSVVFCLHFTRNGYLLLGMYSDYLWIKQFNETGGVPGRIANRQFIQSSRVRCILENPDHTLWFCSEQGFQKFSADYRLLETYDEKKGFASGFTYAALPDQLGNLWISTNKGIHRLDPKTGRVRIFSPADNLQDQEFNTGAYAKGPHGTMLFGGIKGFNIFDPTTYHPRPVEKQIILNRLRLGNNNLNADSIQEAGSMELQHDQNDLEVSFAVPEFLRPGEIRYFYRLSDKSAWTFLDRENTLFLSNLAPGKYTLQVKAMNADMSETPVNSLLRLIIHPPMTATNWFRALVTAAGICLIGGFFYLVYRQRLRLKMAELEKEKELMNMKQRIGRDLHDHLGASITRLNLMAHALKLRKTDTQAQFASLSGIAAEMKQQVDEIVWTVNLENDFLNHFLAYVRNTVSDLADRAGLRAVFEFPEIPENIPMNGVMRQNLMSITKEAVNNTIKYASSAEIKIRFDLKKDGTFVYCITDTGAGFNTGEVRPFANGIRNMQKRCDECRLAFSLHSTPGRGTEICISGNM